jgi:hypothetical protein
MSLRSVWFLAVWLMSFAMASADVVQIRDTAGLKAALPKLAEAAKM